MLLSWYVGGLNFQVEHHLFPKICSIHYPAISDIVRDVAQAYKLPYNQHPTLMDAIRCHYHALKRWGRCLPAHADRWRRRKRGRGAADRQAGQVGPGRRRPTGDGWEGGGRAGGRGDAGPRAEIHPSLLTFGIASNRA
jgi:hypothetical protein